MSIERTGRVQSVDRAVALLQAVAGAAPLGGSVALLAQEVGLNRATAWRLLATLEDNGLVERDPGSGRYLVGPTVTHLAAAVGVDGLVRRAHPVLERLCALTGETTALAMVRPTGLTYVDEVSAPSVMNANWLGRSAPLHTTSSGKVWLAWLPEAEALGLLDATLAGFTQTTITDRTALVAELRASRAKGFSTCRGEYEAALYGVSAPVLVGTRPVAVISIWGLRDRIPQSRFDELGAAAIAAAAEISGSYQQPRHLETS